MTFHPLASWFNRTPFALKFAIVGLAIAGPLLLASGITVASWHAQVQGLKAVGAALERADQIRTLVVSVAHHRGLTATVLAGGETARGLLVKEQGVLLPQFDRALALLGNVGAGARARAGSTTLHDAPGLRRELQTLMQLPADIAPADNFQRHSALISVLLSASARLGQGLASPAAQATENDIVFVRLPMLIEELGRLRGWGSAILTQQNAPPGTMQAYFLYAGAVARRLEIMRADPATLARLDRLHGGLGQPMQEVLAQAESFLRQSMAALQKPAGDDSNGARHFAFGTTVINQLAAVNENLVSVQRMNTGAALATAERARLLAGLGLAAALLLLLWVYREFSRSTVLRLQELGAAAQLLARSDFDQPIAVDGRDEIAQLGQAMDQARLLLRDAVAEKAHGLAAQHADRAKTDFLARWSHDLRTPLNAVLGFAEVLEGRPGTRLSDAQRADLQQIRRAGAHLLRLVNDVLDITRIETRQLEVQLDAHGLRDAIADALALLQPEADAAAVSIHLHTSSLQGSDRVLADRTRLLQVLVNLVGNAVKFNHPGGRVDVHLRNEGQALCVEVADTGPGIALAAQSRLFMPFERLEAGEQQIPGSGLGLALSQQLAGLMGGQITLASAAGQGSRFTLCLPRASAGYPAGRAVAPAAPAHAHAHARAPAPATAHEHASTQAQAIAMPPGRVAYVEDDPVNALLVREMLAGVAGLQLAVFITAADALAAAEGGASFDLWLIDKQLPDSHGVALLGQLMALAQARSQPAPRAVMLSADALPSSVAPALAAGFLDYWTKPVALHSLRQGVALHLGRARAEAVAARRPAGLATITGSGEPPT